MGKTTTTHTHDFIQQKLIQNKAVAYNAIFGARKVRMSKSLDPFAEFIVESNKVNLIHSSIKSKFKLHVHML